MNLLELKNQVDFAIDNLHSSDNPEEIPVLITLSEPSLGARNSIGVKYVSIGVDWERNQFRILPETELVRRINKDKNIKL